MNRIKKTVYSSKILSFIVRKINYTKQVLKTSFEFKNEGCGTIKKELSGSGHKLIVGDGTVLNDTVIHMKGRNNTIVIGKNCHIGPDCSLWTEGENCNIIIGDNVSFTRKCQLNVQENGMVIKVGNDCMFSNTIVVRTSDSHPIYSLSSNERINDPAPVSIGNHVWVAPNSKIMKGVKIGDGAIIGSDTLVTKDVPANALVVGHPARVVKNDIKWTRNDVIFLKTKEYNNK